MSRVSALCFVRWKEFKPKKDSSIHQVPSQGILFPQVPYHEDDIGHTRREANRNPSLGIPSDPPSLKSTCKYVLDALYWFGRGTLKSNSSFCSQRESITKSTFCPKHTLWVKICANLAFPCLWAQVRHRCLLIALRFWRFESCTQLCFRDWLLGDSE